MAKKKGRGKAARAGFQPRARERTDESSGGAFQPRARERSDEADDTPGPPDIERTLGDEKPSR